MFCRDSRTFSRCKKPLDFQIAFSFLVPRYRILSSITRHLSALLDSKVGCNAGKTCLGVIFESYSNAHLDVGEHLLGRAISTRRSSCVASHLRSYFFSLS